MKRMPMLWTVLLAFTILLGQTGFALPTAQANAEPVPPEASGWVLISTAEQLAYIDQNQPAYVGRNIRLTNDIDMNELNGYTWIPFGDESRPFTGIFDGRGYKVSGIVIDDDTRESVGFFGRVKKNDETHPGVVRNLGVSVQVTGGSSTGGLVGMLDGGSIDRSYSKGTVKGGLANSNNASAAGGLVGQAGNSSIITNSYSFASAKSAAAGNQYVGGLVGSQGAGTIANTYATGLVGSVADSVSSLDYFMAGGLVGQIVYGQIEKSYATGTVTNPTGTNNLIIGGFVGVLAANAAIVDSYFDTTTTTRTSGVGSNYGSTLDLAGRTTDEMKQGSYDSWDFAGQWALSSAVNSGYPYLRPVVLTDALPPAVMDVPYSPLQLEAFNGAGGALAWSASGLPAGMEVTASGLLRGTPSQSPLESGSFTITVTVTDAGSNSADAIMMLEVESLAPNIADISIGPGNAFGTAKATATAGGSDRKFAYLLGDSAGVRPILETPLPAEALAYTLESDILASAGQYLQVYETDADDRILAWSSVQLQAAHIQDQIRVTGVSLDKTGLTLTAGQSPEKLTATIVPANASNKAVTWSSDVASVATVDNTGQVTPLAEGTAIITVTTQDGSYSASATITVLPAPPTVGTVTGTVYGAGNAPLTGATVSLIGIGSGTTDGQGRIALTDIAAGIYTLTVTATGYETYTAPAPVVVVAGEIADIGRIDMTLAPIAVTGVTVNPTELTLTAGQSPEKLTATIVPANASNQAVTWSSSNASVATVDGSGNVTPTPHAEGTATITVTTQDGSYTASATITVLPAPPTVGTVTGTVYGAGNAPLPGATITLNAISRGTTDSQGSFTLTDIAAGTYTVTVTATGYETYTAPAPIEVVAGEIADVGRIDLQAIEPPSGNPGPSPNPGPQATVKINGKDVRVSVIKETDSDGRSVIRLVLDAELARSLFAAGGEADIAIDTADPIVKVDLPAGALQDVSKAQPDASIRITANGASYKLPLRVWGGVPSEATVTVMIAKPTDAANAELDAALARQGFAKMAEPMEFALYVDGVEMTDIGGVYTERTIALDAEADPNRSTVVWVEAGGRLHFVPSVFRSGNGETEAAFYAPHNSLYAAIRSDRTFADANGHWAQGAIELLANKLVVQGTAPDAFAPNRTVTRAEFAAMLVRALGLVEKPGGSSFSDVRSEDAWYAGAVGAASEAGLIEGYKDGTFKPDALITREQLVAMLARAIRYAGELPQADASVLQRFADDADVAEWAREPAAQLLAAHMIDGVDEATFAPQAHATRAQSAVLLTRMLRYLKFID